MTVPEAAKIMKVSPQFLRALLEQRKVPFGECVKGKKIRSFYINDVRFQKYMDGEL